PGNVRELRNAIERAILLCDGGLITREHLPSHAIQNEANGSSGAAALSSPPPAPATDGMNLEVLERNMIRKALVQSKGNKTKTARALGLTRAQLYSRLEKYGVE